MNEDTWTAISAVATAASAVTTALAFGGVVWQSRLTSKALRVSQTVALDAARSRLDAGAPQVAVRLEEPVWPPLAAAQFGMPLNPWPTGHSWHFPRGQDDRTFLQAEVVVENHSSWPVQAQFEGDLFVSGEDRRIHPAPTPVLVPGREASGAPGTLRVYLQKAFSTQELAENHDAHENGRPLPHTVTGAVTVHDDRDNGIVDTWNMLLTGHPVMPDPDRGSVWIVVPDHIDGRSGRRSLQYDLLPPRERTYWVSRRRMAPLDQDHPVPVE
ncbi:hypothetical protein ACIO8G_34900 [Streptomyces sp. NPDC087219]|uniref:hypothetical protein n=1 Tax=Streptomyces sp. NPDC087219 TaxID=3365770 RepID=UPI0038138AFA